MVYPVSPVVLKKPQVPGLSVKTRLKDGKQECDANTNWNVGGLRKLLQ